MATKKEETIVINPIEIRKTKVRIVGDTPLIVHAWSDKAKQMILDAQTGKNLSELEPVFESITRVTRGLEVVNRDAV